jgi:hypothetical protein
MIATTELRFVEREVSIPVVGMSNIAERKVVRILQQKWRKVDYTNYGVVRDPDAVEWRDVPVVKEASTDEPEFSKYDYSLNHLHGR